MSINCRNDFKKSTQVGMAPRSTGVTHIPSNKSRYRICNLLWVSVLGFLAANLALAPAAKAQFNLGKRAGLTVGSSVGALMPVTELEDEANLRGFVFVRHGIIPRWQFELNGGYGRFNSSYSRTHLGLLSGSLLFCPIVGEQWNMYLRGGVGILRYDWDHPHVSPLRRLDIAPTASLPMIPLSSGIQFRFSDHLALELSLGYNMALSDEVNGVVDGGDDAFWQGMVGLTLGSFGAPPVPMPARVPVEPPVEVPEVEVPEVEVPEVEEVTPAIEPEEPPAEVAVEEPPVEMPDFMEQGEVHFSFDSTGLSKEAKQVLASVVQYLVENPEVEVVVRGHTDSTGPVAYNLKLGKKRAQSVKDYLVAQGIDGERLKVESRGESEPISTNFTEAGRKLNRRVEIAQVP